LSESICQISAFAVDVLYWCSLKRWVAEDRTEDIAFAFPESRAATAVLAALEPQGQQL
jgi:hypothetical protein